MPLKIMLKSLRHFPVLMVVFLTAACAGEPQWYEDIRAARMSCDKGEFAKSEEYLAKALSSVSAGENPDYQPAGVGSWRGSEPRGLSGHIAALADSYMEHHNTERAAALLLMSTRLAEDDLARLSDKYRKNSRAVQDAEGNVSETEAESKSASLYEYDSDYIAAMALDLQCNLFLLGDLNAQQNNHAAAESAYTKGLSVLEKISPIYLKGRFADPGLHEYLEDRLVYVGEYYYRQGKLIPAKICFMRALSITEGQFRTNISYENDSKGSDYYKSVLRAIENKTSN